MENCNPHAILPSKNLPHGDRKIERSSEQSLLARSTVYEGRQRATYQPGGWRSTGKGRNRWSGLNGHSAFLRWLRRLGENAARYFQQRQRARRFSSIARPSTLEAVASPAFDVPLFGHRSLIYRLLSVDKLLRAITRIGNAPVRFDAAEILEERRRFARVP